MLRLFSAIFSFSVLMLISGDLASQENCDRTDQVWKNYKRFIPSEESPVFTMRVNIVIPQKSDGTGNFQEGNPDHDDYLNNSLKLVNHLWSSLKEPKDPDCYPHDDFVPDSHIRFKLNEVIYVQDDYYWNADNGSGCPNNRNWFMNGLEEEIRANPKYDNAINIYMPNFPEVYQELVLDQSSTHEPKGKPPCSELPSNKVLDRSSRINISGNYNKFWWMKHVVPFSASRNPDGKPWDPNIKGWMVSSSEHTLAHELGHSMGLSHANEYHGRNKCDESIMNQLFGKPHTYLQPSEIGKIHRNLRMTNIRNFLVEDIYSPVPMIITEDLEFALNFKSYEDIIIKEGATMTLSCEMSLPDRAKIIVEPGGTLIIRGASLSHRASLIQPAGIELQREKGFFLFKKAKRKVGHLLLEEGGIYKGRTYKEKVKRL